MAVQARIKFLRNVDGDEQHTRANFWAGIRAEQHEEIEKEEIEKEE